VRFRLRLEYRVTRRLHISSSANDRLKGLRRILRRPQQDGVVVVHGYRSLRCALEGGETVREVVAAPELFLGDNDARLVAAAERRGAKVVELGATAFGSLPGPARPDGLLALVERPRTPLAAVPTDGLLLVAARLERPGNLGTLIRTACAAGAAGVVVAEPRFDPYHAETVRASVGTIFALPVVAASATEVLAWWPGRIVVATPDADRSHWEADYRGPVAVVVGNERVGVSDTWQAAADEAVRIPLPGAADSLNVAVAAGIVLFEALRARGEPSARSGGHRFTACVAGGDDGCGGGFESTSTAAARRTAAPTKASPARLRPTRAV
jgi:TrmH family RNA methyltransferase